MGNDLDQVQKTVRNGIRAVRQLPESSRESAEPPVQETRSQVLGKTHASRESLKSALSKADPASRVMMVQRLQQAVGNGSVQRQLVTMQQPLAVSRRAGTGETKTKTPPRKTPDETLDPTEYAKAHLWDSSVEIWLLKAEHEMNSPRPNLSKVVEYLNAAWWGAKDCSAAFNFKGLGIDTRKLISDLESDWRMVEALRSKSASNKHLKTTIKERHDRVLNISIKLSDRAKRRSK